MTSMYDENSVVLSFDVEWANAAIVNDVVRELDKRNLVGTFFCTHEGINVPGHERGLHPNFRRDGDTIRQIRDQNPADFADMSDDDIIRQVLKTTHEFCPEAVGLRTHSLYFELKLLAIMKELDFAYDSSCFLPMQSNISPFSAMWGVTEIPIYYMDHMDLVNGQSGFRLPELKLDQKGLKVFNFHPALIYLNAEDDARYQNSKPDYANPEAFKNHRYDGRGTRSLFLDLIDAIASGNLTTTTMGELCKSWKSDQ
jgi:hypothetical protein